jgi:hypothetical protein
LPLVTIEDGHRGIRVAPMPPIVQGSIGAIATFSGTVGDNASRLVSRSGSSLLLQPARVASVTNNDAFANGCGSI